MFRLKNINFSFAFTVSLVIMLVIFSFLISYIFNHSIINFVKSSSIENKKVILSQAKKMIRSNADRLGIYYSEVINNLSTSVRLIALNAGHTYDDAISNDAYITDKHSLECKKNGSNYKYNISEFVDKAMIKFSNKSTTDRKGELIAKYIFFNLEKHISNIWSNTSSSYMNDVLIVYRILGNNFLYVYPNSLKGKSLGTEKLKKAQAVTEKYYEELSPAKNPEGKLYWSKIRKSVDDKFRLISVIAPIYTKNNIYIGAAGITLKVDTVLFDMFWLKSNPKIIKTKNNYILSGTFEFVMTKTNDLLAFPIEYKELFSLPKINSNNNLSFYSGSLNESKDPMIKNLINEMKFQKNGVGYPQLSAVIECSDAAHGLKGLVCADGGCTTPGDVSKAFAAGSDFVMLGGMLAGHDECKGEIFVNEKGIKSMRFYGMSSAEAMNKHHGSVAQYRSAEGKSVDIPYKGSVEETILDILGGIRSTCTYVGAQRLKELSKRTTFIRVTQQLNEIFSSFEV